jgi:ABC-type multidrug transport system permease subunit
MYGMSSGIWEFGLMSGLVISTAAGIFMAVSSFSKNFEQANQLAMPILTILFLVSGFFVPATKIPSFWACVSRYSCAVLCCAALRSVCLHSPVPCLPVRTPACLTS